MHTVRLIVVYNPQHLHTLPQLLQRPQLQLVPQLLGSFLYLAHTTSLVHGILAAEKLAELDCASIPISYTVSNLEIGGNSIVSTVMAGVR